MKGKTLLLIVVLIAVVLAIYSIESSKPKISNEPLVSVPIVLNSTVPLADTATLAEKQKLYPLAPEIIPTGEWLNTEPLSIAGLRGKVVLVDFWTYSCINCIRTLPYLRDWDAKYRDAGLVIIGVHTPEFNFEKELENVKMAAQKYNLTYPIVQDNDYRTWRAYSNRFWPRKYLVDIDGFIRYDHIGEGGDIETETVIQELLKEKMERFGEQMNIDKPINTQAPDVEFNKVRTPELYLGAATRRHSGGNSEGYSGTVMYAIPQQIERNVPYVSGTWTNNEDNMELADTGSVYLDYDAKNVNIVAGAENGATIDVYVDDVFVQTVSVKEERLYDVVNLDYGQHSLELKVKGKGFKIYTFTFG